jgi:hypothetical protein
VEHIRGDLWHRYSITVNQVMVASVKLSKWWLQLNLVRNQIQKLLFRKNVIECLVLRECHSVPLVANTSCSFPHSRLITWFVTRLTRRVPLVEQELLTISEHLSSPPVFNGVRAGDKSWMRKGTGSVCDKWNISVVICDTDIPLRSTKSWWRL